EMKKANRIVSFDWEKYDQSNVVYNPARMTGEELRLGHKAAYETFYAVSSIARRFPYRGGRNVLERSIYNLFMRKGSPIDCKLSVAPPTPAPALLPIPPFMPLNRECRNSALSAIRTTQHGDSPAHRRAPRGGTDEVDDGRNEPGHERRRRIVGLDLCHPVADVRGRRLEHVIGQRQHQPQGVRARPHQRVEIRLAHLDVADAAHDQRRQGEAAELGGGIDREGRQQERLHRRPEQRHVSGRDIGNALAARELVEDLERLLSVMLL